MTHSQIPTDLRPLGTTARAGLEASTLPPESRSAPGSSRVALELLALVLLWSRDEPERVGEVLLVPSGNERPWTFGRSAASEPERRLGLIQQRPASHRAMAPLRCPRLSRSQLRLTSSGASLIVENVGSGTMLHEGRTIERAEVKPGEVLALHNELLFLCTRRAPFTLLPAADAGFELQPFGAPDEFGIVGESEAIWDLRQRIVGLARQPFHVLVLGESGSGKELVAQAIHSSSPRGKRPLVARNAATIPEGLADAELFGSSRNYPNAGMPERAGLIGQAHESTLFLDEFAELSPALQTHLLRVMDSGDYQRLGEASSRHADVRLIAATNRAPTDIRHDVLARLKLRIAVPALGTRREDIPLLVAHLLRNHAAQDARIAQRFFTNGDLTRAPRLSPGLVEALVLHEYTGNVRELDSFLLQSALESRGHYLELTPELRRTALVGAPQLPAEPALDALSAEERSRLLLLRRHGLSPTACGRDPAYPGNRQTADLHLRGLICRLLRAADWNTDQAAKLIAGDAQPELLEKASLRIETFVANIQSRLEREGAETLAQALNDEWRGNTDSIRALLEALRMGKLHPKLANGARQSARPTSGQCR